MSPMSCLGLLHHAPAWALRAPHTTETLENGLREGTIAGIILGGLFALGVLLVSMCINSKFPIIVLGFLSLLFLVTATGCFAYWKVCAS